MSKLGDIIRTAENQINEQVQTTKNLALRNIDIKIELGGAL